MVRAGWPCHGEEVVPPSLPELQGLSGHYLGLEYEVNLRLGGFDVKLYCFPAVQQRDEAGSPGDPHGSPSCPVATATPCSCQRGRAGGWCKVASTSLGSSLQRFPCTMLLAGALQYV